MSLVTRCPSCSTLFKVVPDQIRIAAGWVRCGHCGVVFDASTHLLPREASTAPAPANAPVAPAPAQEPPAAAPPPPPPVPWVEAPPAPPQAMAANHSTELPQEHPPEAASATAPSAEPARDEAPEDPDAEPSDLPSLDPDPLDLHSAYTHATEPALLDPLETETPWPERPHPDDEPASEAAPLEAPPSFVAAARRRAFWASRPVRALLWLVAALGVLALAGQWVMGQRDWLAARAPQSAPVLRALCAPLGCQIRPYRQLDAIVIDSSAFNRVAGSEFRFSVSLRNSADWPVASPALELVLTDRDNQPLLRRVLTPAELGAPPALAPRGDFSTRQGMTIGAPVDANAVAGYRLTAFYP